MVTRATTLHRDRPDEDPAAAPTGLRWEMNGDWSWSLREPARGRSGRAVGHVWRLPAWRDRRRRWVRFPGVTRYPYLPDAARALVEAVRRG
jgi:hypothetical protein